MPTVNTVPIGKLEADRFQPRQSFDPVKIKTLAESIKIYGVMVPLVVEERGDVYIIIDGERRYRASKQAGLQELPVRIVPAMTDVQRLITRFQLQEQNEHWDGFDKAMVINKLQQDTGMSKEDIARELGLSPRTIENYLVLLELSQRTRQITTDKKLPISYIREIYQAKRAVEDDRLADKLEAAIVTMIDTGTIQKRDEIRLYSRAIRSGGDSITKKIISENGYSPKRALKDSGGIHYELVKSTMNIFKSLNKKLEKVQNIKIGKSFDTTDRGHIARTKELLNELF